MKSKDGYLTPDGALIKSLGGISHVARMLDTTPQRVWNWVARGHIPSDVKVAYPRIFLKAKRRGCIE